MTKRISPTTPGIDLDSRISEAIAAPLDVSDAALLAGKTAAVIHQDLLRLGKALDVRFSYGLDGIEACVRYVVDRYGWLPATVRAMSEDDLHFLLRELQTVEIVTLLPPPPFSSGLVPRSPSGP